MLPDSLILHSNRENMTSLHISMSAQTLCPTVLEIDVPPFNMHSYLSNYRVAPLILIFQLKMHKSDKCIVHRIHGNEIRKTYIILKAVNSGQENMSNFILFFIILFNNFQIFYKKHCIFKKHIFLIIKAIYNHNKEIGRCK